ncbi:MAG: DivIVA domain-containing protein, partial [Acidimicrobiales bacterium]
MADEHHAQLTSRPSVTPEEVVSRSFGVGRKGFDQAEVRRFLERVSSALQGALDAEEHLTQRLAAAEERAAHPDLDEDTLTQVLGQETAQVLHSAREAAARLRSQAQDESEALLAASRAQVTAKEAEMMTAAKEHGRAIVADAKQTRAQVLAELAQEKEVLQAQIDKLAEGQEMLSSVLLEAGSRIGDLNDMVARARDAAHRLASPPRAPAAPELGALVFPAPPEPGAAVPAAPEPGVAAAAAPEPGVAAVPASPGPVAHAPVGPDWPSREAAASGQKGSSLRRRGWSRSGPDGPAYRPDVSEHQVLTDEMDEGVRVISSGEASPSGDVDDL